MQIWRVGTDKPHAKMKSEHRQTSHRNTW
jgi:hypothetical protein